MFEKSILDFFPLKLCRNGQKLSSSHLPLLGPLPADRGRRPDRPEGVGPVRRRGLQRDVVAALLLMELLVLVLARE